MAADVGAPRHPRPPRPVTFQAPRGTYDLLPPRSETFLRVREVLAEPLRRAGYGYVETPLLEDTELFARGVGESTDVVSKEMYSFSTRGGDAVSLRPEGTASVVRAVLEHRLDRQPLPLKLWYAGSFFRYERPQKGRYRHFSQVGAEVLGSEDPLVDAELVVLAMDGYRGLGLSGVRVLLNSLGSTECRRSYRSALQAYLRRLDLDDETRQRVELNPLRVLDDKRPHVQALLDGAPLVIDHLTDADRAHHDAVLALLGDAGVDVELAPRLVRGLDYYTRTLVEFVHDGLGAQSAVGGGGRYDGLAELVGGPRLPGVGFALGVDRTVLAMVAEGLVPADEAVSSTAPVDVFAVPLGDVAQRRLFGVVTALRRAGVRADLATGGRSVKAAMKAADRSGARLAVLLGERDLADGDAQVKDMVTGEQRPVPLDALVGALVEDVLGDGDTSAAVAVEDADRRAHS